MNNLLEYKKVNLVVCLLSAFVATGIYAYYLLGLCIERCSYEIMEGILDPIFFFFLGLTIITAIFLILPAGYFKIWSRLILPIATILIVINAVNVSVYTSSILSMSRAETVRFDMAIFGVVTIVFILIQTLWMKLRKNKK